MYIDVLNIRMDSIWPISVWAEFIAVSDCVCVCVRACVRVCVCDVTIT